MNDILIYYYIDKPLIYWVSPSVNDNIINDSNN